MALIYDVDFNSQTRVLSLLDKAGNVISSCEVPSKELIDDPNKPLMLRAIEDNSSVMLRKYGTLSNTYQTSTNGKDWTDYTLETEISLNKGESVYFRCNNHPTTQTAGDYVHFAMTGKIEAWHNAYSMISSDFSSAEESVGDYGMNGLFERCPSLTKAPLLLNALAPFCYFGTFLGTSITQAPELPATTLAKKCYYEMFLGTPLTQAPALPATTLAEGCYEMMFDACQSLTKAPELPATTLAAGCYKIMFSGCRSLNEVRCQMPSTISAEDIPTYTGTGGDAWLSGVSSTGTFYTNADANWPSGASGIPEGWQRVNEGAPAVDDITKPLTLRATQDGSTVKLNMVGSPSGTFQTSRDGGNTWSDYTINTVITLNTGDEVSFRAKADRTSAQSDKDYFYFMMEGKIEAWHNVMSLYRTNDFATYNTVLRCAFYRMFRSCQSLTKAPVLPATTLASDCYYYMFGECPSLAEAPALPATTLASGCYSKMFAECPSLAKAPALPATTLAQSCYTYMFFGCQSLKEVRVSATTTATNALTYWLNGVSATGDFYCDPNATIFPSGTSGIPANWSRKPLSDYPN